ncbi:SPW repeat protein [Haladaptatus sp. AB643]|uniref:SPW repeat domain-containing protein n=1 Tax=Haladaptatus sp. AB643 TaxID=2934174 RepID=UPI00209C4BC3|nr:SPW repeat protein [Haladaptatus sp. AB643]MCO8243181.1 SPW repeat protein [Haladaptatus sp. AB643]
MSSTNESTPSKWASGANVLLGLWLFFIPTFVWSASGASFWNDIIVGAAITIIGAYGVYSATNGDSPANWSNGLNTLLGLWMIASAFIWGGTALLFWNDIVVGVVVAVLAGFATFTGSGTRTETSQEANAGSE